MFLSPIEVPVGSEPGALEWWQDTVDSEPDARTFATPSSTSAPQGERHNHEGDVAPRISPEALNSPTEIRRRAIAESIVRNMRLWNSDSESFTELSSDEEEEKSSCSWVTEEEEVIIGVGGSELQQEEAELEDSSNNNVGNCRDVPKSEVAIVGQRHPESGVESAESWFTSSDNSHSQLENSGTVDKLRHHKLSHDETSLLETGEAPRKTERGSVCSSVSTDDSLAWETACEDLPAVSN